MKILIVWCAILLSIQEALTPGNVSGGMKRMEEMIVNWKKSGVEITIITTPVGEVFLKREGIDCRTILIKEPRFFQSFTKSRFGVSVVYLSRTVLSIFSLGSILTDDFDAICATSHYLPDLVVLFYLSLFSRSKTYLVHLYHVFPLPFVGAKYQSIFVSTFNWVQQLFGFALIRNFKILTYLSQRENLETYGFNPRQILTVGMGVNLGEVRDSPSLSTEFDAVFLGRLTRKKGIFDLLHAWKEIAKILPSRTLCLAGPMSSDPVEETIDSLGLRKNVILFGVVDGARKYGLLKSADIFVFPSYEEGWGVVVSEALSCGLPAVVYDLPAYEIFGDAVIRVPVGNIKQFAEQVIFLLSDKEKRTSMSSIALKESSNLDWKVEAERELNMINSLVQSKI
jgi:glycosyltransferase involved in cell wall biosynthesis